MNFQKLIENRLLTKKKQDPMDSFHDICFILAKEFGWSYNEVINTPSPYILEIAHKLIEYKKKEAAEMKKKRK